MQEHRSCWRWLGPAITRSTSYSKTSRERLILQSNVRCLGDIPRNSHGRFSSRILISAWPRLARARRQMCPRSASLGGIASASNGRGGRAPGSCLDSAHAERRGPSLAGLRPRLVFTNRTIRSVSCRCTAACGRRQAVKHRWSYGLGAGCTTPKAYCVSAVKVS